MPSKNLFFNTIFSACYFLKVHLHYFSKIKSQKEPENSRIQGFSDYFCMMIEGSGLFLHDDRRIRIQSRIREAEKHVDPVDPDSDPEHCHLAYFPIQKTY
jgi:hypothetical protein